MTYFFRVLSVVLFTFVMRGRGFLFSQEFRVRDTQTYDVGLKPEDVVVEDFNNDGAADIAVANSYFNQDPPGGDVSVFVSRGSRAFRVESVYSVGIRPEGITAGFFDADDNIDLATANFGTSDVTILLGDGNGNFRRAGEVRLSDAPRHVVAGDFDGDGDDDLATANYDDATISVLRGLGDGSFGQRQTLVVGNNPETVAVAEVNGDAHRDLLVANPTASSVQILHGSEEGLFSFGGSFEVVRRQPRYLAAVDLDGDGYDDFLTANWRDDDVSVVHNEGGKEYRLAATLSAAGQTRALFVSAGDLTRDGNLDVVVSFFNTHHVGVFPGTGGFSFGKAQLLRTGRSPYGNGVGDFDNDGQLDLAVANTNSFDMTVFLGSAPLLPPRIIAASATPDVVLDTETSSLEVVATDPDDGPKPLSFRWSLEGDAGSLDDPASRTPRYFPPEVSGTRFITVRVDVSDGVATTSAEVTITVEDGGVLLRDDFDDGDFDGWSVVDEGTVEGPAAWDASRGIVDQTSNVATVDSGHERLGTFLRYDGGDLWTDYRLRLSLSSSDNDALGVMFRVRDSDNYYRFSWNLQERYRRVTRRVDGRVTLLAEDKVAYRKRRGYDVEISVSGPRIEIGVDGESVFSLTDGKLPSGGIALYSWANRSSFDNVLVEDLSAGGGRVKRASPRGAALPSRQ